MSDLIIEIKSFSIKVFRKRQKLIFKKFGESIVDPSQPVNNSTLIPALQEFINDSFEKIKSKSVFSDDFLSIPHGSRQKKLKIELIEVDTKNSCIHGVYTGGITGDEGNFNKKNKGRKGYQKTPFETDDFVDNPFFFTMYFPINSDTGILIMQKYSNHRSMTIDFRTLLIEMFRQASYSIRYDNFITDGMKDTFSKTSIVEKITMVQKSASKELNKNFLFLGKDKQYKIKVEISEIDTPTAKFIDNVKSRVKKELSVEDYANYFPELNDLGLEKGKTRVTTSISDENGRSNVKFTDVSNYLDKLIPKITVPENLKVVQTKDSFHYKPLRDKLINILHTEIIPSLED